MAGKHQGGRQWMGPCYGYRVDIYCGLQVTGWQFHRDWGHEVGSKASTLTHGSQRTQMFRGLQSKDFHVSSRFPSFLRWDLPVVPRLALTFLAQVIVPVLGSWWDTVLSLSELLTQTSFKQGAKTQTPHSHQALCSLTALCVSSHNI